MEQIVVFEIIHVCTDKVKLFILHKATKQDTEKNKRERAIIENRRLLQQEETACYVRLQKIIGFMSLTPESFPYISNMEIMNQGKPSGLTEAVSLVKLNIKFGCTMVVTQTIITCNFVILVVF